MQLRYCIRIFSWELHSSLNAWLLFRLLCASWLDCPSINFVFPPLHRCSCALHSPVDDFQGLFRGHRVCLNEFFSINCLLGNVSSIKSVTVCACGSQRLKPPCLCLRCWDINEDSPYWWIIKGPIVVSIAVNVPNHELVIELHACWRWYGGRLISKCVFG